MESKSTTNAETSMNSDTSIFHPFAQSNATEEPEIRWYLHPQDESGCIGEEQLPSAEGAGPKTDKQVWDYEAANTTYNSLFGKLFRQLFKGQ